MALALMVILRPIVCRCFTSYMLPIDGSTGVWEIPFLHVLVCHLLPLIRGRGARHEFIKVLLDDGLTNFPHNKRDVVVGHPPGKMQVCILGARGTFFPSPTGAEGG